MSGAVSRPCVGVVMLNTSFPRFHGDIGNPSSFDSMDVVVRYKIVDAATVGRVVTASGIDENVTDALLEAIHDFCKEGVDLILTSCGFLSELQVRFQRISSVPVLASALELLPLLRRCYGNNEIIAVMTYDSRRLNTHHLGMVSSSEITTTDNPAEHENLVIQGMENATDFYSMIAENKAEAYYESLAIEVSREAQKIKKNYHQCDGRVAALVLECTNLSPFRQHIHRAVGVPVFDILDAARFFVSGFRSEANRYDE